MANEVDVGHAVDHHNVLFSHALALMVRMLQRLYQRLYQVQRLLPRLSRLALRKVC